MALCNTPGILGKDDRCSRKDHSCGQPNERSIHQRRPYEALGRSSHLSHHETSKPHAPRLGPAVRSRNLSSQPQSCTHIPNTIWAKYRRPRERKPDSESRSELRVHNQTSGNTKGGHATDDSRSSVLKGLQQCLLRPRLVPKSRPHAEVGHVADQCRPSAKKVFCDLCCLNDLLAASESTRLEAQSLKGLPASLKTPGRPGGAAAGHKQVKE